MILILFVLAALGFFYHRVLDTHGRPRTIGSWATARDRDFRLCHCRQ